MAYLGPVQLALPNQFDALDHAHKVRDFGLVDGRRQRGLRARAAAHRRSAQLVGGRAGLAAGFLGAGYGAYMSVDQALITAVLPDALSRAKDLGIMNVGSVGPQALAPLGASLIIATLGGYPVLFATSGVTTIVGAILVTRIRSVR